jgi:hypothetical protein
MINWRKILVAYISHVDACEGYNILSAFTAVEKKLTELEREYLLAAVEEAELLSSVIVKEHKSQR